MSMLSRLAVLAHKSASASSANSNLLTAIIPPEAERYTSMRVKRNLGIATIASQFAAASSLLTFCSILLGFMPASLAETVRFATYNVSLYSDAAGKVAERIAQWTDKQAATEAEIIQRVRPDVLLLNEVDYDARGSARRQLFRGKYLEVGQNVSESPEGRPSPLISNIATSHHRTREHIRALIWTAMVAVTDKPGSVDYGADSWGFGQYPGQYGMVILSKYPIDVDQFARSRTFSGKICPGHFCPMTRQLRAGGLVFGRGYREVSALVKEPLGCAD